MATRHVPPRLHAILARTSPRAVVIAKVRHDLTCTIGWDRRHDRFEVGQWVRARLYPLRSDLSTDGSHFVYFAFDGRRIARGQSEAYTAVSRTPYLKAIAFWPKEDTWTGGGLFMDDRVLWVNGHGKPDPGARLPARWRLVGDPGALPYAHYEDRRVYYPRLLRDGWTLTRHGASSPSHDVDVFERPLPHDHVLEKAFHATIEVREEGRGCYYEEHALVAPGGGRIERPDWEWADLDEERGRIVYASRGRLEAVALRRDGVGPPQLLFDANALRFEAIAAPY